MNLKMNNEEEETVFDTINRHLDEIQQELHNANEALIVIASELYLARRDFTDVLKRIHLMMVKLAKAELVLEEKPVSAVQEPSRFEKMVFPKSALQQQEEETE